LEDTMDYIYIVRTRGKLLFFSSNPTNVNPREVEMFRENIVVTRKKKKTGAKSTKKAVKKKTKKEKWFMPLAKGLKIGYMRKLAVKFETESKTVSLTIEKDGEDEKLGPIFVEFLVSERRRY